jgi:transposase
MTGTDTHVLAAVEPLLGPSLTADQARQIFEQGAEATVFALLTLAKMVAEKQALAHAPAPTAPSGMKPPYQKPPRKSRRKTPGRKAGHAGSRRPAPTHIDGTEEHVLESCPSCDGPVTPCRRTRTRLIEDIPRDITVEVTQHTIHRYWCSRCRKVVEPVVANALPGSTLGLRVLVLSAWLHYALGNTLSQIVEVFNYHLRLKVSTGGLMQMWYRLQAILFAWYLEIQTQALDAAVLHADETGWRVAGKTHWLWCFTTTDLTYYLIDRKRGKTVVKQFFRRVFNGTLVTDFWAAYNSVVGGRRQKCLPHLLREIKKVQHYHRPGGDWPAFAKRLKRLLRDGLRLRRAGPGTPFPIERKRLEQRLQRLIDMPWQNCHARRLVKRLRRHGGELFTFLEHPEVPFDNNHGERAIRPAVIIRKNSYANGSDAGADLQAVLMSIYRTLKQRGHNPLETIVAAVQTYLKTGQLPPLPGRITENG